VALPGVRAPLHRPLAARLRAAGAGRGRDGDATHIGTRDQVRLSGLEVARPAADDPTQADEDAWRRWLDEHGIDWDGDGPAS
jgi:hypothetical protein